MFSEAANRRYNIETVLCFTCLLALEGLTRSTALSDPARMFAGFAIILPIGAHIWATIQLLRSGDEFVRILTVKRFVYAWSISMLAFIFWGLLESYSGAPHAPSWLLYPLFWASFAITSAIVRTTHR